MEKSKMIHWNVSMSWICTINIEIASTLPLRPNKKRNAYLINIGYQTYFINGSETQNIRSNKIIMKLKCKSKTKRVETQ